MYPGHVPQAADTRVARISLHGVQSENWAGFAFVLAKLFSFGSFSQMLTNFGDLF